MLKTIITHGTKLTVALTGPQGPAGPQGAPTEPLLLLAPPEVEQDATFARVNMVLQDPIAFDTFTIGGPLFQFVDTPSGGGPEETIYVLLGGDDAETWTNVIEAIELSGPPSTLVLSEATNSLRITLSETGPAGNSTAVSSDGGVVFTNDTLVDAVDSFYGGADATYASMIVSGVLTDGTDPVVFPVFNFVELSGGKPRYLGGDDQEISWFAVGSYWQLLIAGSGTGWTSTQDVATPDLATVWTPSSPATGTPIVTSAAVSPTTIGQFAYLPVSGSPTRWWIAESVSPPSWREVFI